IVLSRTLFGLVCLFGTSQAASYQLYKHVDSKNFESEFEMDAMETDPTLGNVLYVDKATAKGDKLLGVKDGEIYIGVDHRTKIPSTGGSPAPAAPAPAKPAPANQQSPQKPLLARKDDGISIKRKSVRVKSADVYNSNTLFIFDVSHAPVGPAVWPAIWTFGNTEGDGIGWPNKGEIDIMEGINSMTTNSVSLHMDESCKAASNKGSTNELTTFQGNCNEGRGGTGCKQETKEPAAYGTEFNKRRGGVYAMEWTDARISVWFFPRGGKIPDIKNPDPASWGKPMASFTNCDFRKFRDHRIIINITLCGQWAGKTDEWGNDAKCPGCKNMAMECKDFVAAFPEKFTEAYWQIKTISTFKAK
ncbi:hypothetical protein RB600_000984, partial [Gaeumannomyces tritici]